MSLFFLILFLIFDLIIAASKTKTTNPFPSAPTILSSEECLSRGFNFPSCSVCSSVNKIDVEFFEDCKLCCKEKSSLLLAKYDLAVLEVDKRFLPAFPDVQKIIEQSKKVGSGVDNLAIRYRFGSRPQLLLYENRLDELPSDTININSWTADVIEEYLKTMILKK